MKRSTAVCLLCISAFCLLPSAFCQLVVRPGGITVKPASGPLSPVTSPPTVLDPSANPSQELQDRLQAFEADSAVLRRRNELNTQTIHTLTESLAVANAECELFKRQYADLKLRMEALGLASVGDNKEALEQRLLQSVNDLRLLRAAKDKMAERMVALSETVLLYLKTSTGGDAGTRMEVEAQLRAANQAAGEAGVGSESNDPADLGHGRVISVNESISLVVVNLGAQHGVKLGMPFQITRDNRNVGHARVVDVRDRISGAIVEDFGSNTEKVKIGDGMRVDVQS